MQKSFYQLIKLKTKASEDVSKQALAMKFILYGDQEHEPVPEQYQQLASEVFACGLISRLIVNLPFFEFEVGHKIRNKQKERK